MKVGTTPYRETTAQCASGIKGESKEEGLEGGTFWEVEIKGASFRVSIDHT